MKLPMLIEIPIEPRPKQRPRVAYKGGRAWGYTEEQTRDKGDKPSVDTCCTPEVDDRLPAVSPIIWETGNIAQIRSLLVLREAELVVAKAQLTGDAHRDWYVNNVILDLEIKIADLKRWLAEGMGKRDEP